MKLICSIKFRQVLIFMFICSQVSAQIVRKPYIQKVSSTGVVVCWMSGTGVIGKLYYGTTLSSLNIVKIESEVEEIYHEIELEGLQPGTKYYYSVEDSLKGKENQYFITSPKPGDAVPTRIWVISDFGQKNSDQNDERMETVAHWKTINNNDYHADFVLSLGDQTEDDSRYQLQHNYFNQLEEVLVNSPLFTLAGNHDNHDNMENYLATFVLPANGELGGKVSGTEKYYSFNYSNIHVVMLCSEIDKGEDWTNQTMWLKQDLEQNQADWLIACTHRPFHSGGHHRTDREKGPQIRRNDWLKLLEDNGVDLILQGHNHIYERSYLIDNVIGKTTTFKTEHLLDGGLGRPDEGGMYRKKHAPHQGTVFVTVPGGGLANNSFERYQIFPVYSYGDDHEGSVVIDVEGNRMNVTFLCNEEDKNGSHCWDQFTIIKEN